MNSDRSWIAEQQVVRARASSFWIADVLEFDRPSEEFLLQHCGPPVREGLWVAKESITFLKENAPNLPILEDAEWYLFWFKTPQLSWTRCFLIQKPDNIFLFLPIIEALLGEED